MCAQNRLQAKATVICSKDSNWARDFNSTLEGHTTFSWQRPGPFLFPYVIVSLRRQGLRTRKRRAPETGFEVPDSRTSGVNKRQMTAHRSITFKESLCKALSGLNLENMSLHIEQKEAISNIVVLNRQSHHLTGRATSVTLTSGSSIIVRKHTNFLCLVFSCEGPAG